MRGETEGPQRSERVSSRGANIGRSLRVGPTRFIPLTINVLTPPPPRPPSSGLQSLVLLLEPMDIMHLSGLRTHCYRRRRRASLQNSCSSACQRGLCSFIIIRDRHTSCCSRAEPIKSIKRSLFKCLVRSCVTRWSPSPLN